MDREDEGSELRLNGDGAVDVGDESDVCDCCCDCE